MTAIQKFSSPIFRYWHLSWSSAAGAGERCEYCQMKFGHHGGNHPVKDVEKNVVMITAQNHGFAVYDACYLKPACHA
ncbi:hypothetical protein ACNKHU_00205 [Shigella flexneri]